MAKPPEGSIAAPGDPRIGIAEEIMELLRVRVPDIGTAAEVLINVLCPLMVAESVSIAAAQHDIAVAVNYWFEVFGAQAAEHFKAVQPKAQ